MSTRSLLLMLGLSVAVAAQQLEPNTPGGSLLLNGQGPTGVGSPIGVGSTTTATLTVGGAANAPYTLLIGSLAATSIAVGPEFVDISFASPIGTIVDGFGINLSPSSFPSTFGNLNGAGQGTWAFGLNAALIGSSFCFQAVVLDLASPIAINLTGCPEMLVAPFSVTFSGDDVLNEFTLNTPLSLYGFSSAQIAVSSNGWISLSHSPTHSGLGETVALFTAGTAGGALAGSAPIVACLWDDLDQGNVAGQNCTAVEATPGVLQVTWTGDYYPATPMGSISCTIDSNLQAVTFDYSGFITAVPPIGGIVGVSNGGATGVATSAEIDLASGGFVNPYASAVGPENVFQSFFATSPFPGPFDLGGLTMTMLDVSAGSGFWTVF